MSPGSGLHQYVGAWCVVYDFEDLLLSAALMQQTDVLICVHGKKGWIIVLPHHNFITVRLFHHTNPTLISFLSYPLIPVYLS